jgi:hypothetical protein
MIKKLHNLTDEEKFICQKYVDNERNEEITAKQVNKALATFKKIIAKPSCQTFIGWRSVEHERKSKLDFNYKIYKLKRVVDEFIPDDEESALECRQVAVAISAIAESNKMQGHYSAEKVVSANVNLDADLQKAREIMDQLIAKHKRDY